jgi:hypothetical protein
MIDYLVAAPDLANAKTLLATEGVDVAGVWQWAQTHVFPVQAWLSTSVATRPLPDGTIENYQAPNYDTRYWVVVTLRQPRDAILNHPRCVLAWDAATNVVLTNKLTAGQYAALQVSPRILGHAWLGKPS